MERRAARSQTLPPEEADLLRSLKGVLLYARARELYSEGWTLRSIGEVFSPAKSRSTVRYWITKHIPLASSGPVGGFPTAPIPTLATPRPLPKVPRRRLSATEETEIAELAPLARKYRASMNHGHPASIANKRLTELVVFLHKDERVTIAELSAAAGVSYRAMARRIGNA